MKSSIKLTKMQGCGNDFVILNYEEFKKIELDMPVVAKKLCDRNFGIGADGLIIPNLDTEDADIGWFFYNSAWLSRYLSKPFVAHSKSFSASLFSIISFITISWSKIGVKYENDF